MPREGNPWLECKTCSERFDLQLLLYGCPSCAKRGVVSPVEVTYDLEESGSHGNLFSKASSVRPPSLWRWADLLPPAGENKVTLGEGNTPLIPLNNIANSLGVKHVYLKHEASNPSGSFKDRLNTVAISMGLQFGFSRATTSSAGNQAVSVATYARAAGMECIIFCPPFVEEGTLKELLLRGARPVVLSRYGGEAIAMVDELVRNHGWYTSARNFPRPFANPFGLEGYKTIAFELVEQLGYVPNAVFVPTGGGDSVYGIWKGFRELYQLGAIQHKPRMFVCQSRLGGASLVHSFDQGLDHVANLPSGDSKAISIGVTQSGDHGLWAVRESDGGAFALEEDEITDALVKLGAAGVCIEPASAVSVAAALKAGERGDLGEGETIVCIGTATGLRWRLTFEHLEGEVKQVARIDPELDQLNQMLKS